MNYRKLSKILSLALRHRPQAFGISLDPEGWTDLETLLLTIREKNRPHLDNLSKQDVLHIQDTFEKQRFELKDQQIRALYGHSVSDLIEKTPQKPPEVLYHGTSPLVLDKILKQGLLPMNRQYVHLSSELQTAQTVGKRHHAQPVILQVKTQAAQQAGVLFYHGNQNTWLSQAIPPKFLDVMEK